MPLYNLKLHCSLERISTPDHDRTFLSVSYKNFLQCQNCWKPSEPNMLNIFSLQNKNFFHFSMWCVRRFPAKLFCCMERGPETFTVFKAFPSEMLFYCSWAEFCISKDLYLVRLIGWCRTTRRMLLLNAVEIFLSRPYEILDPYPLGSIKKLATVQSHQRYNIERDLAFANRQFCHIQTFTFF